MTSLLHFRNDPSDQFLYQADDFIQAMQGLEKVVATVELIKAKSANFFFYKNREATQILCRSLTDAAFDVFYVAFQKRVAELKIDPTSKEYIYAALAMKKLLANNGTKTATLDLLFSKIDNRIYSEMLDAFACKPLASITPYSFVQYVALLQANFQDTTMSEIEVHLRKAINAIHDATEFQTFIEQLSLDDGAGRLRILEATKAALKNKKMNIAIAIRADSVTSHKAWEIQSAARFNYERTEAARSAAPADLTLKEACVSKYAEWQFCLSNAQAASQIFSQNVSMLSTLEYELKIVEERLQIAYREQKIYAQNQNQLVSFYKALHQN
jgi:hypothetical protein